MNCMLEKRSKVGELRVERKKKTSFLCRQTGKETERTDLALQGRCNQTYGPMHLDSKSIV